MGILSDALFDDVWEVVLVLLKAAVVVTEVVLFKETESEGA